MIGKFENSLQDKVMCLSLTQCGRYLTTGDFNGFIFIWNTDEFRMVKILERHEAKMWCLKITQNDTILLSGSIDKCIKIWQLDYINNLSKITAFFENKEINMGVD